MAVALRMESGSAKLRFLEQREESVTNEPAEQLPLGDQSKAKLQLYEQGVEHYLSTNLQGAAQVALCAKALCLSGQGCERSLYPLELV